ncbi:MAG: DNA polymerase III subunit delta [Candidatus Dojkabacteria bacterium]|jgi:DNA polymerase-3 subunit delta
MIYKLYHGSSPYLSLRSVHSYIDKERKDDASIEVIQINADFADQAKLIDVISSQNLFAKRKLIFIKRIYKHKKKDSFLDELLATVKQDNSTNILIFWEDQKVKSNTKYYKFFKENDAIEESEALNKRTFFTWVKGILKEKNIEIDSDALKELAERTNYDPERCSNEIKKLLLNDDAHVIKKEDISNIVSDTLEKDIWNLIDSINNQDNKTCMEILERLKKQNTDPNYIISMLARNLRLITLTKFLDGQRKGYKEIASSLKVPPFTVPSLLKTSKKYSEEKIKKMYMKMGNLDFQIKKGLIDGNLGLTLLLPYIAKS